MRGGMEPARLHAGTPDLGPEPVATRNDGPVRSVLRYPALIFQLTALQPRGYVAGARVTPRLPRLGET